MKDAEKNLIRFQIRMKSKKIRLFSIEVNEINLEKKLKSIN